MAGLLGQSYAGTTLSEPGNHKRKKLYMVSNKLKNNIKVLLQIVIQQAIYKIYTKIVGNMNSNCFVCH